MTFALTSSNDLIVNGVDIYRDVKQGVVAWSNSDYVGAGRGFGQAMQSLLLGQSYNDSDQDRFLI
eukprot:CAMPEP_0170496514 /NCGR_PEP_ID=MMETSP0208-20121228/21858_1 /TAXON_ID=197538 /ORGANISM="Strombidium inclinatum, Strain S3" /LENGTH=64 /DNA_ID=CAMNT_0010773077 /DNA_START=305 /DNA_END=499 /DNA_ORIENTATION=+